MVIFVFINTTLQIARLIASFKPTIKPMVASIKKCGQSAKLITTNTKWAKKFYTFFLLNPFWFFSLQYSTYRLRSFLLITLYKSSSFFSQFSIRLGSFSSINFISFSSTFQD